MLAGVFTRRAAHSVSDGELKGATMRQFIIYRNGSQTLTQRLEAAMSHYHAHHEGQSPAAVAVNPKDLEAATETLKALDVTLPIVGNGGCMTVEVWLQVAEAKP